MISGFLITQILQEETRTQRFSLRRFYERRARRILPALLFVVAVCTAISWNVMLPEALQNFGQSAFATLLMSNNLLLSLTTGYWDLAAEFKPLLHTWSLGVEEQFYVVFPLLMVFLTWARLKHSAIIFAIAALAITSFALAQYASMTPRAANYYLPHLRAWEILAGCVSALIYTNVRPNKSLASIGVLLILGSAALLDGSFAMPSAYLLPTILGSCLTLLFAHKESGVGRALSWRPAVLIGLMSYSLYLWHQPVYAFARIVSLEPPHSLVMALLTALIFLLSYLTWAFVEAPFRQIRPPAVRYANVILAALVLGFAGWGLTAHLTVGFPGRVYNNSTYAENFHYKEYNSGPYSLLLKQFNPDDTIKVLVAGDSQARDFLNMGFESGAFGKSDVVYRDTIHGCFSQAPGIDSGLIASADLLIISDLRFDTSCLKQDIQYLDRAATELLVIGPKDFGYNINPFIFESHEDRPTTMVRIRTETTETAEEIRRLVGDDRFIDVPGLVSPESRGQLPVFDAHGDLVSAYAIHLTRAGAKLFGPKVFSDPRLAKL